MVAVSPCPTRVPAPNRRTADPIRAAARVLPLETPARPDAASAIRATRVRAVGPRRRQTPPRLAQRPPPLPSPRRLQPSSLRPVCRTDHARAAGCRIWSTRGISSRRGSRSSPTLPAGSPAFPANPRTSRRHAGCQARRHCPDWSIPTRMRWAGSRAAKRIRGAATLRCRRRRFWRSSARRTFSTRRGSFSLR